MISSAVRPQLAGRTACFSQARQTARALRPVVVCSQQQEGQQERSLAEKLALPAAAVMGAALMFAATPDPAEAARSGGRVGGSSGFRSAPRSAPRAAPSAATSNRVTNNVYVAPPIVGGFGYGMPFGGFGGFGFYPMFGVGFGTIFNIMALLLVVNVVLSVVQGFTNQKQKKSFDDEDW